MMCWSQEAKKEAAFKNVNKSKGLLEERAERSMEILEAASVSGHSDYSGDREYSFASPIASGSGSYQMHPYHHGFTPPHLSPPMWQEGVVYLYTCTCNTCIYLHVSAIPFVL